MRIIFGLRSEQLLGISDWDYAETHALGGAETALLRMASTFRSLGHEVEVVLYPSSTKELRVQMAGKACDIFISSRLPGPILQLQQPPGRVNYYWAHDDADQPMFAPLIEKPEWRTAFYQRLTGLFFLSHYQRAAWTARLGLVLEKTHLISNPIAYERFQPSPDLRARGPLAYYASTPYRGLRYLLQGWPLVRGLVPLAEVEVFSSLKVNGQAETAEHQALYEQAQRTPGVRYHGAVSQAALRDCARRARVLAYPCCFPETSCIVAMEAMAAGAVVVGTELGALPETAWKNPMQPLTDGWLERWAADVARLFVDDDWYEDMARQNIEVARVYDAEVVARRMSQVFRRDLAAVGVHVGADLR